MKLHGVLCMAGYYYLVHVCTDEGAVVRGHTQETQNATPNKAYSSERIQQRIMLSSD